MEDRVNTTTKRMDYGQVEQSAQLDLSRFFLMQMNFLQFNRPSFSMI